MSIQALYLINFGQADEAIVILFLSLSKENPHYQPRIKEFLKKNPYFNFGSFAH